MAETLSDSVRDEVDHARAREYSLLSVLLLDSPDAQLLARLANLRGDTSVLGSAHDAVAQAAVRVDADQVSREYFNLFVGVGRGELRTHDSCYPTGPALKRQQAQPRAA